MIMCLIHLILLNYCLQKLIVYFMKLEIEMFMNSVLKIKNYLILVDIQKILSIMVIQIRKCWAK